MKPSIWNKWNTFIGCIHLLNIGKYCDNTHEYVVILLSIDPICTWKMWSRASAIFANIVTILVSFEAILKRFSVRINFKSQFQSDNLPQAFEKLQNCFKTYKYCDNTREYCICRWTHFSSIGSILVSITTLLTSIVTILASIEQVNTPLVFLSVILSDLAQEQEVV